jgi:hypothetical protein
MSTYMNRFGQKCLSTNPYMGARASPRDVTGFHWSRGWFYHCFVVWNHGILNDFPS